MESKEQGGSIVPPEKDQPQIGTPAWIAKRKAEHAEWATKRNRPEAVEKERDRIRGEDEAFWGLTLAILTTVREYRRHPIDGNYRLKALEIAADIYSTRRDQVFAWTPEAAILEDVPGGAE